MDKIEMRIKALDIASALVIAECEAYKTMVALEVTLGFAEKIIQFYEGRSDNDKTQL